MREIVSRLAEHIHQVIVLSEEIQKYIGDAEDKISQIAPKEKLVRLLDEDIADRNKRVSELQSKHEELVGRIAEIKKLLQ